MQRNTKRWWLTDPQKIVLIILVSVAGFLAAMSLGMGGHMVVALVAAVLVVTAFLTVFLLGLRYNTAPLLGTGRVLEAPPPPANQIVGKCDVTLLVQVPGRSAVRMRVRDAAAPVIKWPTYGMELPVEVPPENPRKVRIRWDGVPDIKARAAEAAITADFDDDFDRADFDRADFDRADFDRADFGGGDYGGGHYTDSMLASDQTYEEYVIEENPAARTKPTRPPDPEILNGTIVEDDDRLPVRARSHDWPWHGIPQPRPARAGNDPSATRPAEEADPGIDVVAYVSNLSASLRFYVDALGLRVVESSTEAAVLAHGSGRIVLRHKPGMSQVDRRLLNIHIRVPDIDSAFERLERLGIPYAHRPKVTSRTDTRELWTAVFHDPDGHGVGLIEWRDRP